MNYIKSAFICAVMASQWGCSETPQEEAAPEQYCLDEAFKKNIELAVAARQPISEGIHLTGTVEANPDNVVVFRSLFSGVVSNVNFSLGDQVQRGQVLAEISSTEYSALNAELQSVMSQIKVAQSKLHAMQAMAADGIASERELNETQSELDILNAQRAKVAATRDLYSASSARDVFQVKAPSTGVVTSKAISPGMQITAAGDDPLFTLSNLEDVWVMANVYASSLQDIEPGMDVEIRTMSYSDVVFTGKISKLSQVLDASAKVLKARIELKNKDLKLKPGMLADITVLKKLGTEAVSIPTSELIFSNNENYVVVHRGDCDVEVRKVTVLTTNNETAFIQAGLEEGEKVISKNQLLIFNRISR